MSTLLQPTRPALDAPDPWGLGVTRSPLLPIAGLFTLGVLLDHLTTIPCSVSIAGLIALVVAWAVAMLCRSRGLALVYLAGAVVLVGVIRHQAATVPADPALVRALDAGPVPVQVIGTLAEEPLVMPADRDVLRSRPSDEDTRAVLALEQIRQGGTWQPVAGRVHIHLTGRAPGLHLGDRIEATGMLAPLPTPSNPGESDFGSFLSERGILGRFFVSAAPGAWQRLDAGWLGSPTRWLMILRGHGQSLLAQTLPPSTAPLAMALLLGEGAPLERTAWERYVRTGIVAVLAVSGQHLVILAIFLGFAGRVAGVRIRHSVGVVAMVLLAYALLTGGRAPALRAAIMALTFAAGILLRRRTPGVNDFALAWLVVGLVMPADLISPGCQFSFLAIAILVAYPVPRFGKPTDPLQVLLEQSDPLWWQAIRGSARFLLRLVVSSLALWLVLTPLSAWHYHLVSPAGIVLSPPLTFLATIALFVGFTLFLLAPWLPGAGVLLGGLLHLVLSLMQWAIDRADAIWGAWLYVPDLALGLVLSFYAMLMTAALLPWPGLRWQVMLPAGLSWLMLVGLWPSRWPAYDELRVTFLSVGHGGCVVLELPGGRVAVYDVGSLRGPSLTARQIAPFLWSRGIVRIDEVLLSHADLDHFNGLSALLERFAVGRVCLTPSFSSKPNEAVRETMRRLRSSGTVVEILHAGQALQAGPVEIDVLHPPVMGPAGSENVRSLVLRITYAGRSLLLTGDLEGAGLDVLLRSAPRRCEVLMLPHHGSSRLDPSRLLAWSEPTFLVACQGAASAMPVPVGMRRYSTHTSGAVTFRGTAAGWSVETFR